MGFPMFSMYRGPLKRNLTFTLPTFFAECLPAWSNDSLSMTGSQKEPRWETKPRTQRRIRWHSMSRGFVYIHYKVSLWKLGWPSPIDFPPKMMVTFEICIAFQKWMICFFSASVPEKFQASKSSRFYQQNWSFEILVSTKNQTFGSISGGKLDQKFHTFSQKIPRGTYMSVVDFDGKPRKLYTFYRGWNTTQLYRD